MAADEALGRAQQLGYAEADPSKDVSGLDAAYKLAILASLAFHTRVEPGNRSTARASTVSPPGTSATPGSLATPSSCLR